ncbi:MAG: BatA domain-containing protein [Gemmataceae bacterium]
MEFFAHPWYMAAGGALISAPILIHLINRVRFKRVRWAAMEFLLKSQKRSRRRMIVEQLILLLLRILLVLLAAFLVARFLYGGTGPRGATHLVIVDDTLSMNDFGKAEDGNRSAFASAIGQVKRVAQNAAKAPSAQYMQVYLLSQVDQSPLFEQRLSDTSESDLEAAFATRGNKPTMLAGSVYTALTQARKYFSEMEDKQGQKYIHFVSDFRDRDWTTGPEAEKLADLLKGILEDGINLNLIDVASPFRTPQARVVTYHDNLAVVDLKAESRVAVEDSDIEFTASIMNFGAAEGRTFLKVYINGEESPGSDTVIERMPPLSRTEHKFTLRFLSNRKGTDITPKDSPEERERKRRREREYNVVRVALQREESGLNADNVRDLVIEVRKKVPTLVIDGNKPENRGEGSDMFHLQAFYEASGIYEIEERRLDDLARADLDLYPGIILLNVPELTEAAVKKLQAYVANGGSLMWFLGEETKSDHYNNVLFKADLFPVLLEDRYHDPLAAQGVANVEDRVKLRAQQISTDPKPKILFPDPENVMVRRLAPAQGIFRYLAINVYWKAQVRSNWDPDGRLTKTLVSLPNTRSIDEFRNRAFDLVNNAQAQVGRLAAREKEYERYLPLMEEYRIKVRNAIVAGDLYSLAQQYEALLTDQAQYNDRKEEIRPSMADLWKKPELVPTANEMREFRERVLFGDPLVVSKQVGKGRVIAMMTAAGSNNRRGVGEDAVQWNNFGSGGLVSTFYPLFLLDTHRYMISEGLAPNRLLGEETTFTLDAARYLPEVSYTFEPQPDVGLQAGKLEPEREQGVMEKQGNQLEFALRGAATHRPGVYRVTLTQQGDGALEDRQEVRAYAYNVDALAESDLKRAGRDRLDPEFPPGNSKRGKLMLLTPNESFETLQEKQPDASESPWLYLFFILILVVEQAMAVHLSYHLKSNESAAPVPGSTASPVAA